MSLERKSDAGVSMFVEGSDDMITLSERCEAVLLDKCWIVWKRNVLVLSLPFYILLGND